MIENFLDKFLPQITERLNENEEVGKALIEALAVLDNYATINNVQFTDEQVNAMLGIVPEPIPEPNADIPAEIIQAEENTWTWRFKTQEELENEFGTNWRNESNFVTPNMDYLLGKSIQETDASKNLIENSFLKNPNFAEQVNPYVVFGISRKEGNDKKWVISANNITNQPLPTAAAWSWRFKTQKELREEFGYSNWRKRWGGSMRDYLFGKSIPETPETIDFIDDVINKDLGVDIDTISFGISNPNSSENYWEISKDMLINKPLPTVTWNWRFKTAEEFREEYGDDWETELGNKSGGSGIGWVNPNMNYLLGQKLEQNLYTENLIIILKDNFLVSDYVEIRRLGIDTKNVNESWTVSWEMFTDKSLPTTPKKRGRKPKSTAWSWRFKTEQEFIDEYGGALDWRDEVFGQWSPRMDYLLGQRIQENFISKSDIEYLENQQKGKFLDTADWGIDAEKLGVVNPDNKWSINITMLTQDPLPTAAAPKKSVPKKRGRKPKSQLPEIDLGGLEDIGDIDIGDIDFDNLVI
jgi:hypothetical protein